MFSEKLKEGVKVTIRNAYQKVDLHLAPKDMNALEVVVMLALGLTKCWKTNSQFLLKKTHMTFTSSPSYPRMEERINV